MNDYLNDDNSETYYVNEDNLNKRLDVFLTEKSPEFSRSYIKKNIDEGLIFVNGKKVKAGYKLCLNDEITVMDIEPKEIEVLPEDIPLDIIYEDSDIIVVNKPKGMVVHPAPGHYSKTLVNALLYHCKDSLSGINGVKRPGIVHRIDKDTSGVLVVCKNDTSHKHIAEQLKVHSIKRIYKAIAMGEFKEDKGTITGIIGRDPKDRLKMALGVKNGKEAITHYKVLGFYKNKYSLVECRLETGRTHQIRVSLTSIGHPLLGDPVYSVKRQPANLSKLGITGQMLHAEVLGIIHPTTGEYMEFKADLPEEFHKIIGE